MVLGNTAGSFSPLSIGNSCRCIEAAYTGITFTVMYLLRQQALTLHMSLMVRVNARLKPSIPCRLSLCLLRLIIRPPTSREWQTMALSLGRTLVDRLKTVNSLGLSASDTPIDLVRLPVIRWVGKADRALGLTSIFPGGQKVFMTPPSFTKLMVAPLLTEELIRDSIAAGTPQKLTLCTKVEVVKLVKLFIILLFMVIM